MIINPGLPGVPSAVEADEIDDVEEVDEVDAGDVDVEAARAFAARMDAAEERWFVMYGAGSRSYWAFPLWDPGVRLVLEHRSPDRLLVAMREAEAAYLANA